MATFTDEQLDHIADRLAGRAPATQADSRRATWEKFHAAESEYVKFRDRAATKRAAAQAEVDVAQKRLEAAHASIENLSWSEESERQGLTAPLAALSRELEDTAPPQIDLAIQDLYERIGAAPSFLRSEVVRTDPNGRISTAVVNRPEVEHYESACRRAVGQLEALRRRWVVNVDREIAGILNTIRAPK